MIFSLFCIVYKPSLTSLPDQLKPVVRKTKISCDFSKNFVIRLPQAGFRKVSEASNTCTLLHSSLFHSIRIHSTNVSSLRESNFYKRYSRLKNLICSERWQGEGVPRQDAVMRTPKRYKTQQFWIISYKHV